MKRKLIKAAKDFYDHLNEPLKKTHPQIEFIPPVLFRLMLYGFVITVVIGIISKIF